MVREELAVGKLIFVEVLQVSEMPAHRVAKLILNGAFLFKIRLDFQLLVCLHVLLLNSTSKAILVQKEL